MQNENRFRLRCLLCGGSEEFTDTAENRESRGPAKIPGSAMPDGSTARQFLRAVGVGLVDASGFMPEMIQLEAEGRCRACVASTKWPA
jgi:hypothetical protein